jgi:hypothetical protein
VRARLSLTPKGANVAILALSAILLVYDVGVAVSQFAPWADYGLWFVPSGKVIAVDAHGPGARAGVRVGDQLVPAPRTMEEGFAAAWVVPANRPLEVRTLAGPVVVRPQPQSRTDALLNALSSLADAVFLAAATLLCLRRPGVMAISVWLFATGSVEIGPSQAPLLGLLPPPVAFAAWIAVSGLGALSQNFAIVPFALRFPTGRIAPRLRVAERAAWAAYVVAALGGVVLVAWSARSDHAFAVAVGTITTCSQISIVAAAILVARFLRMDDVSRAQTAWALIGFCGALVAFEAGQAFAQVAITLAVHMPASMHTLLQRVGVGLSILGALLPLCAVYPVLRYRLFELGFVVNRATLFSVLTIAAIGSLAAVNWLAQHVVYQRLAFFAQPVAAILIGVGFMRVRDWTKHALERLFFRRRFAAEQHLNALAASLATAVDIATIDTMVVDDVAATLELRSAAIFRPAGTALMRAASVGWPSTTRNTLDPTIIEPRELLALAELPPAPDEPVLAVPLLSGGELAGVIFYGRHHDATEIDPEERSLLLRIGAAAASAYQIAELKARLGETERGPAIA